MRGKSQKGAFAPAHVCFHDKTQRAEDDDCAAGGDEEVDELGTPLAFRSALEGLTRAKHTTVARVSIEASNSSFGSRVFPFVPPASNP